MRTKIITLFFLLITSWGCSKQPATEGRSAAIALKDGTTVTGTVTGSDMSSVTIRTANGVVSTYPMNQVTAINYTAEAPVSTPGSGTPGPSAAASTPAGQPAQPAPADSAPAQPTPAQPAPAQPAPPPASAPTPATTATAQPAAPPPAPTPAYHSDVTFRTVPAGSTLSVRTDQTIDSQTALPGQTYTGVVARDVVDSEGRLAIPHGSTATLVIRNSEGQGKVKGQSEVSVDVGAVQVNGRRYRLETTDYVEKGRQGVGANKRTGEFAGGGGLLGTIVGAVAGGGKGAAIGALSGAAAGASVQTLTRGKAVRIPSETILNFRLEAPIRIREIR